MEPVHIYTMTNHRNPRGQIGKGIYTFEIETDKGKKDLTRMETINATPNEAAVEIINRALEHVAEGWPVEIYTDNQYVANGLGGWAQKWQQSDWKTSKGNEIANCEGWKKMMQLLKGREYNVHLKEAHSFRRWQETQLRAKGGTKYV
jgi:ribonuclease HI